jgi:D-serine deaminase-like pyridoxal phosphate-dependent protein
MKEPRDPHLGQTFAAVDTPALLLDLDQVERNIRRYQQAADAAGLRLRPHAKAHKCPQLGKLQLEAGATGLCCAKLAEAEALAEHGLAELLVTTPVVGALKLARLIELARKAKVSVVADSEENIAELGKACAQAGLTLDVLVDVDVGQGRTGVAPGDSAAVLARRIKESPSLRFRGLQAYQGKLQGIAALDERTKLVEEAMARLGRSEAALREAGFGVEIRTGGGSGSFPIDLRLKALTELQPGSYVTMDTNYAKVRLGGTDKHPLGQPLTVLASVVSRPAHDRAVVDVGWKAASSDSGTPLVRARDGLAFEFAGDEHGIVRASAGGLSLRLGERIELVPSHCDTTVNLYDAFVVHRSGKLETTWPIVGRGKSQ